MSENTIPFSCNVATSDASVSLNLKVLLDGTEIFNSNISDKIEIKFDVSEEDAEHELQFEMSGKTQDHTKIDEQGNIVKDVVLSISDLYMDGIDITKMFFVFANYTHDFNGSQPKTTTSIYGDMGCNGVVSFKFTTPFYLWLLENM